MKNNNSYINNATLNIISESAEKIALVFGGKITRDDTKNTKKEIFSDEELNKFHDSLYIVRVDFSEEKHNALEITATSKQFYIAYGDTISENIISSLSLRERATKIERKEKWNMKNKCLFSLDTFKEIVNNMKSEEKREEKREESTKNTKKESTKRENTKKRESTKKESKTA